jgi:hypothetical protein
LQQETGERPERNFSEFNPNAGIELAALTAILGSFAGAASGRAALKSMKGITEGYRLGQQDLYERSAKEFEYELQKHRDKYKRAKENYDLSMKSEEAKRGTAMAKLREFAPELSGTIGEAHLRNNNIPGYKNYLDEWAKFNDQMAIKAEEAKLKPPTKPRFAQLKVEGTDARNKKTLILILTMKTLTLLLCKILRLTRRDLLVLPQKKRKTLVAVKRVLLVEYNKPYLVPQLT